MSRNPAANAAKAAEKSRRAEKAAGNNEAFAEFRDDKAENRLVASWASEGRAAEAARRDQRRTATQFIAPNENAAAIAAAIKNKGMTPAQQDRYYAATASAQLRAEGAAGGGGAAAGAGGGGAAAAGGGGGGGGAAAADGGGPAAVADYPDSYFAEIYDTMGEEAKKMAYAMKTTGYNAQAKEFMHAYKTGDYATISKAYKEYADTEAARSYKGRPAPMAMEGGYRRSKAHRRSKGHRRSKVHRRSKRQTKRQKKSQKKSRHYSRKN